jgi:membrane-associated protein
MLDPVTIIQSIGYGGILAIIFAECGLFFGFFLPGDSLLFTAGFLASQGLLSIVPLIIFTIIAAILGESVGFAFGKKIGPMLFEKLESRFFKPAHVKKAHEFFVHHGNKAVFLARFLPIVRTFVPIIAGVAGMPTKQFTIYNIIGGSVWISSMTLLGYILGKQVAHAEKYLYPIILGIVLISFIPAFREWQKAKKKK